MVGVHGGKTDVGRVLGEAHGSEAPPGIGADLIGGHDRIAQPRDLQWDDALGVGPRPHLAVPVVPGSYARQAELGVLAAGEHGAGEPGEQRGEVERRLDAADVHVPDALVDVPAAAAHLVEAGRLHAPLVLGSTHDGVEAHVGVVVALVEPHLGTFVGLDHPGRPV